MSWPIDEDDAPITYVHDGRVLRCHVRIELTNRAGAGVYRTIANGFDVELSEENLGTVWARGWNTPAAHALRVAVALT